ncbi:hypothetical protein T440DRAFT_470127 [Plenodomus tracheiphilus IPT5]|uniref:Uncharacterized protein n=1 Tax=Plenodomus tracheiphilus IPT5 TaxID=1408161 RepID=A0A6A7B0B9_9PLEO|nr:hypothetical protein T440DRAFT_470127 [Plenodomus tracheiphilus IPT5]
MSTTETSQPLSRKKSIFRRFSRRESSDRHAPAFTSPTTQPNTPRKLQRRIPAAQTGLLSPPDSPKPYIITSVEATKQQTHQLKMITHVQQVQLSQRPSTPKRTDSHHSSANNSHKAPTQPLQRALPTALPTTSFPDNPLIRPWNVFLPPSQVFSLYLGYLPQEMSDKWFIYSEGPDSAGKLKVHFHRSWTGMKIAELFVVMDVKGEGAGKLVGIKWNGGVEANRMSEEEAKYMMRTTCEWVLGVELEEGR